MSGKARAAVAWMHHQNWKTGRVHMLINKQVLKDELYAVAEALEVALRGGQTSRGRASQESAFPWTKIYIWTDLQAAIVCQQHTVLGPGQWLARVIIVRAQRLATRRAEVEVHCVPGHISV